MRIRYIIIYLLAFTGIANAQYQNYNLTTKNDDTDNRTYVGRDYVRLQNGYSFSAKAGKTMNAKVSSALAPASANAFLSTVIPNADADVVTAIDKTKAVGQIPISSSVSPSGAKCYNVPIEIVPGRQGFQPNISLSYNSQAGNGVVGMGWNISGLSSIERVNKNVFYDGVNETPNLSENDVFALDGNRLILKSSQQVSTRQWIKTFETVSGNIQVDAYCIYNTPMTFKVKYPNGTVGLYGYNDNSSLKLSYPLTQLTDINGSTITFSYDTDNVDLNAGANNEVYYIDEINYGQCGSIPNFAKIKFSYDTTRPDQTFSLESSKSCIIRKRLTKIESFVNSGIIRTYSLSYSNTDPRITSNQNDVSRLTQISSFVNSGTAVADNLNPLKFYYGENISPSVKSTETSFVGANFNLNQVNAIRGKFDVNSQNDAIMVFPKKEAYTTKAANGTYSTNYLNNEQIKVYQNVKDGSTSPCPITSADGSETTFTTGDGFEDVFAANVDGKGQDEIVKVNMRFDDPLGSDWEYLTFNVYGVNSNKKLQLLNSYDYPLGELVNPNGIDYSVTPWKFYAGNFTGGGKTEVLALSKDNSIRNKALLIDLDGGGRNLFSSTNIATNINEQIYPMDIDGDGQTEIVCVRADQTYLYKFVVGTGFQSVGTWALTTNDFNEEYHRQIIFADLNGDGNMDIIRSPKAEEPKYKTYQEITAPSYFANLTVTAAWIECPKCHYVQVGAHRDLYSYTGIVCPKHIGIAKFRDPQTHSEISLIQNYYPANAPTSVETYPKLSNNNTVATYLCPACEFTFPMSVYDWDGYHCWSCNSDLHSKYWIFGGPLVCSDHDEVINKSGWRYTPPRTLESTPTQHRDWVYEYTNGRSIVRTETDVNGILRTNDHKYSIHEINGDDTPDLIIQANGGNTIIFPFDNKSRSFQTQYLSYTKVPQDYEYLDYDLNSSHNYSSLLALGANKLISCEFPYNHTRNSMMSLMVNSVGVVDKTDYSQLSQGTNYTIGNSAKFPYTDFSGTFWVTAKTNSMYNKQIIGNATYSYGGAIMHNQGLGFLGFSSMASTDLMTNKVFRTEFDPIHSGVVTKQTTDEVESVFTYDYSTWNNTKMKLLLTSKKVTDKLKKNTIITSYSGYDEYGNVGTEVTSFSGDITNQSTVVNTWDNKITGSIYMIGMPTNQKVTTVRGDKTFIQNDGYEYFDETDKYRLKFIHKSIYKDSQTKLPVTDIEYKYNADYGTLSEETVHNKITNISSDDLTTKYDYWSDDQCSLWKKTDPYGLTTTYSYDFDNLNRRLLTGVIDYKGNTVTYSYNDWRQKTGEVSKYSSGTAFSTTTIDLDWNKDKSEPKRLIEETRKTTKQPTVMTYVDAFGRETRKSIVGFDDTEVYTDKEYDSFGRLKNSSAPYKSDKSPLLTTYGYDKYNRLLTVVQPNGSSTAYTYTDNEVSENNDGIITSKTTDATGKLVSSKDNGGEVKYTYRPDGQPDKVNTAGVETSFDYDNYGRQTKLIDPSAGTIQTAYDDKKHEITQTWNSGKTITTVIDKYGQLTSKTTPDFTSSYVYENGQPKSVTSTNGTSKVLTYDIYGRLGQVDETVNGRTYQEVYGYDDSRIGSVTYNSGSGTTMTKLASVVYKYKTNGYLYRLEDEFGNRFTETNSVNALGQETSVLLGNGLTTTKNYTDEGLWTNVTTSSSYKTIQNMDYDFNRINGTLNSRTDIAHDRLTESFSYDNLYRLKKFGAKSMDYSASGNILSKTDVGTYSYPDASKPYTLSSVNTSSDLTNQLNASYTVMSRPTSISNVAGETALFTYNDDYDRATMQLIKPGTANTVNKSYFGGGKYEIESFGNTEKQRLYLDGSPYSASVVLEKTSSTTDPGTTRTYYLHRDYLGSITQITDNIGNLAAEYSYDAWGRMRNPADWTPYNQSQLSQQTILFGRGYTGHEHLNGFGLINMNARLYDPLLGRFLAPDPQVASPETTNGFNRYIYASDNPMMYVDLNGEDGNLPPGINFPGNSNPWGNPYLNPNPGSSNFGMPGFCNPYGGPNPGNQGGSGGNQNNGFNGNYGGSGGTGLGSFIIAGLEYIFGPHENSARFGPILLGTPTPYSKSSAKPVTLAKPVGSGASMVYAGGGKNIRQALLNQGSGWIEDYSRLGNWLKSIFNWTQPYGQPTMYNGGELGSQNWGKAQIVGNPINASAFGSWSAGGGYSNSFLFGFNLLQKGDFLYNNIFNLGGNNNENFDSPEIIKTPETLHGIIETDDKEIYKDFLGTQYYYPYVKSKDTIIKTSDTSMLNNKYIRKSKNWWVRIRKTRRYY